jgi:hypothetical protein
MAASSVLNAADRALKVTLSHLFPLRLERWLALGFVAFLEQCGRQGGSGCNIPGSGGGNGGGDSDGGGSGGAEGFLAFMAEHALWMALLAAVVLTFIIASLALIAWLISRGTFMYIDNVATGRSDVARPWREHAAHAGSYFAWYFGLSLAILMAVLLFMVPIGWSIYVLVKRGAQAAPIAILLGAIVALFVLLLAIGLVTVALRDFAAPLQWYRNISAGAALRLVGGLVAAEPLTFLLYLLGKLVFGIVFGIVGLLAGCFTCCLGFLPVVQQTLLQPLLYFERRWSLELLSDLGYPIPEGALPLTPGLAAPPS